MSASMNGAFWPTIFPLFHESRSGFQFRCARSNRFAAANRAEQTQGGFVVAEWRVAPVKTDQAMVRYESTTT